jgi:cell wall-associated NlpC family hydrolase
MTAQAYFSTSERIDKLNTVARAWLGTPYVQNGAVKGCGASCHMLAAAVLQEAGVDMADVPERGTLGRRWFAQAMEAWFVNRPDRFLPVNPGAELMPGDLLLCDLGVGHIALYLGGENRAALQVLLRADTHLASLDDPAARAKVCAVFRPLDKEAADGQ